MNIDFIQLSNILIFLRKYVKTNDLKRIIRTVAGLNQLVMPDNKLLTDQIRCVLDCFNSFQSQVAEIALNPGRGD